jgi:hypothetical protein
VLQTPVQSRYRTHGGLTPPLLIRIYGGVCTVWLVFRRFVCLPRGAYAPRSCVGVRTSAGGKTIFAMHERTLLGAAGVSPPWFANRACNGDRLSRRGRVSTVCPARTSHNRESQSLSGNRRSTGAAGVSPPWFGKRNCRNASGESGRLPAVCSQTWSSLGSGHTGADALPWIGKQLYAYGGAVSVPDPRGAYAPRSCVGERTSAGGKTIFAMQERTLPGAAGVSPPWFRKPCLQRRPSIAEYDCVSRT